MCGSAQCVELKLRYWLCVMAVAAMAQGLLVLHELWLWPERFLLCVLPS